MILAILTAANLLCHYFWPVLHYITVFGESAGAMATADLVTSPPLAKGLFKRAIIQSGHGSMARDIGIAQRLVNKLVKVLCVTPTADGFRNISDEAAFDAIEQIAKPTARLDLRDPGGREPVFGISRFIPVMGDDVLPQHPLRPVCCATEQSRHEHARPLSPPISLVERAMNRVRDHIRDNDLKVGDTLPGEGQFAAKLGVSRPVMREAFGALAALRQIDVSNGRRARVAAIDGSVMASSIDHAVATAPVSVADVRDVRRALELRTVVLAAQNCTNEQGDEIMAAARAMADAADDLTRLSRAAPSHRQG